MSTANQSNLTQGATFLPGYSSGPGSEHERAAEFLRNLPWVTDPKLLLEQIRNLLVTDFHITSLRLVLIDETTETQCLYLSHPLQPLQLISCFQSSSPIVRFFSINRYVHFDLDTPPAEPESSETTKAAIKQLQTFFPEAKLCFPLVARGSLAGILVLGPKGENAPFTDLDRLWLILLTKEVSSALERILGIDELALLGGLSAGIAHDFQNLLTPLSTLLQLYKENDRCLPGEEGLLALSLKNIETIHGYIRHAIHLSVPPKPRKEILRLDQLVRELIILSRDKQEKRKVEIAFETSDNVELEGDRIFILRLIGNLLDNAIKASPPGALLSLQLWEDEEWIRLRFQDQGAGFAPEARKQIFLRTFKIGETEEGKAEPGLGLAICRRIVSLHRGKLIIGNEGKGGARVDLLLPVHRKAASQRSK